MVRAKFKVGAVVNHGSFDENGVFVPGKTFDVSMFPVYDGSEENKVFWSSSQGGRIELSILNPDAAKAFIPGKEYYVDFLEA
jgi:hypothetical protein